QRAIGIAAGQLLEMHDPGEDAGGGDIRSPGDRVPRRIFGKPALHQGPSRVARLGPGADQVGKPAEAMPSGEPFLPGAARQPDRGWVAHQLALEFDVAVEDRPAALRIAGPALADAQPQIAGYRADQGVVVKRAG